MRKLRHTCFVISRPNNNLFTVILSINIYICVYIYQYIIYDAEVIDTKSSKQKDNIRSNKTVSIPWSSLQIRDVST